MLIEVSPRHTYPGRLSAQAHYPLAQACSPHHWECREPASGRGHMGEARRTLGVLISHLRDPWARHPSGSLTGPSMESVRHLVGSASFICLEPWLLFSQSCTASQSCSSGLWMGLERNEPLWQHPTQLGRPGAHLLLWPPAPTLFPKKLGEKGLPWHWAVPLWGVVT